jgi:membrane-associated phospholipid phosphatase
MKILTAFLATFELPFQFVLFNFNKLFPVFSVLLLFFIFINISFCQSVTNESFHIKLRRLSQTDEQTKVPLPSDRSLNGFRVKSSSYTNALINQSGFKGYKTENRQRLKTDKDRVYISTSEEKTIGNSPQLILTNTLAVMKYQTDELFSLKKKDLIILGAVSGITIGLIALDAKLDRSVTKLKDKSSIIDKTSDFITEFGGSKGVYAVSAFAGLSMIIKSNKGIQTSLYAFEAMLNSGLWIRVGKLLAGRERPSAAYEYSKHSSGIWKGPINQIINREKRSVASYDAFPSGHTATIFSIATVFAEQYKDIPFVPIFSYSFATLVGISRMLEHTHWASDVFLGGVIGYICGQTTIAFYRRKEDYSSKKVKFAFKPSISPQNYGADVVMNF